MWVQFCFMFNMQSGSETPKPAVRKRRIGSSLVTVKWNTRKLKILIFQNLRLQKRLNDMASGEGQVLFKSYSTYPSPSEEEKVF